MSEPQSKQIDPNASSFKRALGNTGWQVAGQLAAMLGGLYTIRLIDPVAYGALGAVMAVYGTLAQWIGLRSWESTVKFLAQYEQDNDRERMAVVVRLGYTLDASANGACALLMIAGGWWLASHVLRQPSLGGSVALYGVVCIATIPVSTASAILRVRGRFHTLFAIQTGTALARLMLILAAGWLPREQRLTGIIVATILSYAGESAALWWLSRCAIGRLPRVRLDREHWNLLRGARRNLGGTLLHSNAYGYLKPLYRGMDAILITRWSNPTASGLFVSARRLSDVITLLSAAIQTGTGPLLPVLWRNRQYRQALRLTARLGLSMALVTFVLGGAFILVLPMLINWWQPAYLPALPATRLMVASGIALAFAAPFYTLLVSSHRPWLATVVFAVTCAYQIGGLWWQVGARSGGTPAQIAWASASVVMQASLVSLVTQVACAIGVVRGALAADGSASVASPERIGVEQVGSELEDVG